MRIRELSKELSKELGLPAKEIEKAYKAYWYAIRRRTAGNAVYKDLVHNTRPVPRDEYLRHDMLFRLEGLGWYGSTYADYVVACRDMAAAVWAFRAHGIEFDDYDNGRYKTASGTLRERRRRGFRPKEDTAYVQQGADDDGLS